MIPMWNLFQYSLLCNQLTGFYMMVTLALNELIILGSLWLHCRDEPNSTLTDSESFQLKFKCTGNTNNEGKSTEKMQYLLSN